MTIFSINTAYSIAAMRFSGPLHVGPCSRSSANTRLSRRAKGDVVPLRLRFLFTPFGGVGFLGLGHDLRAPFRVWRENTGVADQVQARTGNKRRQPLHPFQR